MAAASARSMWRARAAELATGVACSPPMPVQSPAWGVTRGGSLRAYTSAGRPGLAARQRSTRCCRRRQHCQPVGAAALLLHLSVPATLV